MSLYRYLWPLALFASLIPTPNIAETALPPILVSATRSEQSGIPIPTSITIITREEIHKYRSRNLGDLLRFRGGVQIDDPSGNGQNTTLDMRGFGPSAGSNTLILVDGRRLNNSSDSASPDLNSIDLRNIERIEIVQGSAGTLFGNQAVGGMINLISRQPDRFQIQANMEAGDYDGYRLHARVSDRLSDRLAYRFTAHKGENHNFRDNSATDRQGLGLRTDYSFKRGALFFEYQYLDDFQELAGSLFPEELALDRRQSVTAYAGDFSQTRSHIGRLGLSQDLSRHWSLEGELTYRDNARDFQTSFRTFPGSEASQDRQVWSLNPRLIGAYPLSTGELSITAGADFERIDYALQTVFGPQALDQQILAVYAQLVLPVGPGVSITSGIRHAKIHNRIRSEEPDVHLDDQLTVGSLGLSYHPTSDWRLFLRADQNYRFATVDEHTNVVYGQPVGIENQTGTSYEAGLEWRQTIAEAKLAIYRLDLQDEISFDTGGFVNTNLQRTRRQGLTLEGRTSLSPRLNLGGSFSYTDPKITAGPYQGKRIPLVSARTARLSADWDLSPHWSVLGEWIYASQRVLGGDFDNRFPTLDHYTLLNTAVRFELAPWSFNLKVHNLLDQHYASSGSVGFDENFTARDAYFPAAERHFWLSLAVGFE